MSWGDRQDDGGDLATIADSLKALADNLPPTRTLAAMFAMQGILANPDTEYSLGDCNELAVEHADDLMARLKEPEPKK